MHGNVTSSDRQTHADAMQFYVSASGNDTSGDGTISRPWRTISHAVGLVPSGQNVVLNLRDGTYVLDNTLSIENLPAAGSDSKLVITGYGEEAAILDGSQITEFAAMISIRNSKNITIENLQLTNLVGNKSGVHVTGDSANITISGNKIHDMHWTTDTNAANTPQPTDNLNPVVIVGDSHSPMRNVSVLNNKVYNLTTGYSEAIKITGNIDGFLVAGNEVYDISNIGIVAAGNYDWVGLKDKHLNHARNGVIRNNEVYRCVSPVAASAGIYVDGAREVSVKNNFSHHNTVGFSVGAEQPGEASAIVLSGNVSADNTQAGLVVGTISPDSMVSDVTVNANELRGNYTNPVWGGGPIIINKSKNVSIADNSVSSISEYMVTVNAASDSLQLDSNSYVSASVDADQAVFSWLGVNNQNFTGFDNYRAGTGQDSQSTFNDDNQSLFGSLIKSVKSIFSGSGKSGK